MSTGPTATGVDGIRMDGRPVLVSGAGGNGIGTAICRTIAAAGGIVVALDLTEVGRDIARDALADHGADHLVLAADVTDEASVAAAVAAAEDRVGPLRGAVNVVGGMRPEHWASLSDPDALGVLRDVVDFNLVPPLVIGRALAASVERSGATASLVHLGSVGGLLAMPYGAAYGASKAALVNLTRTMAIEWGRRGIRVNAVAPGTIRVERIGRPTFGNDSEEMAAAVTAAVPLGRRGNGDEVASAVLFLLSDLASYVNGHTLVVDGGSSIVPPYNDADDLPVFVADPALRARLHGE
jgi:NAD(P)-dependent dehydrogenase (short-subunit alcohol dehydrogenase family)